MAASIVNFETKKKVKILGLVAMRDLFEKLISCQLSDNDIHKKMSFLSVRLSKNLGQFSLFLTFSHLFTHFPFRN